jgi:integrase
VDHDLVFATRFGTPYDGPNVTKQFQAHLARVGLPPMRFHDLRHSAVSFMAAEGVPVEVARAILGRSDARLTLNVYRHILDEEHDRAADVLERLYGGK